MYYNNKFKIIIMTVSIIGILSGIVSIAKPNLRIAMIPIVLILFGLQQLLFGVNYFKLHKKKEFILSMVASLFVSACSVISIILMVS